MITALSGCSDNKPKYYKGKYHPYSASGMRAGSGDPTSLGGSSISPGQPTISDSASPGMGADPLASTTDPLTQGAGNVGLDNSDGSKSSGPDFFYSYYLGGRVAGGILTVSINGAPDGVFRAAFVREITSKLHKGVNTAQFTYEPKSSDGLVDIRIVPGQIDPPLPPVATFRSSDSNAITLGSDRASDNSISKPKPITKSVTFLVQ